MKRTQVQLPEPLFKEVKRVARLHEWSISEVLRRGAEYIVGVYPADKEVAAWSLPGALDLGDFIAEPERWRELANRREAE